MPLLISFVLLFAIMVGCQTDDECETAPFGCLQTAPGKGHLHVQLTINAANPSVPVKVFRGDFENNDLVEDTVVTGSRISFELPVDQYYSVVAEYLQADGDTVFAIDGDDIQVDENDYCEGTCFEVDDGRIDVELAFPKRSVLHRKNP